MKTFKYIVEVSADSEEMANVIMSERIEFEEELQIDYKITYEPVKPENNQ